MPEATVLVFGSPAVGAKLMRAAPALAPDLPLRLPVHEDGHGRRFTCRDSGALIREHGL
ncbi:MAG: DUF302 domain-containing protein [Desulfovibrionaceae bacterium]|nr:DUF302 domain-containing protein [Desulfovibrionaceae bacterium]